MKVYAITDVGRVRPINEDSICVPEHGECFCAVADGMGGHNAGEVASAMAVRSFAETMRAMGRCTAQSLYTAVSRANGKVYEEAGRDPGRKGMGTTFTALAEVSETGIAIAHVGDSRIYLIRNGAIAQVTTDHTWVELMVLKGELTPEQARVHPKRNLITRALGVADRVEIDMLDVDRQIGDVYLLCSDGLSNHVTDTQLLEVTRGKGTWNEKLARLVRMALEDGGTDNITAMYAVIAEDGR